MFRVCRPPVIVWINALCGNRKQAGPWYTSSSCSHRIWIFLKWKPITIDTNMVQVWQQQFYSPKLFNPFQSSPPKVKTFKVWKLKISLLLWNTCNTELDSKCWKYKNISVKNTWKYSFTTMNMILLLMHSCVLYLLQLVTMQLIYRTTYMLLIWS